MTAAKATVINGEAKEIAVASANGSRASAEKLLYMPPTLSCAAPQLAQRTAGVDRARQFATQGVDQQHRRDRTGAAEEHELADRHHVAQLAHECRQGGK